MDFAKLLNVAQQNKSNVSQPIACYKTKYTAPKKETKQSKLLSENIKKFLARKEEEEERKKLEEKKKKENLLSLRDQKTQNKINKHLKVCKAANKSVLADAIDNDNTAITLAGPSQPDEDDYGYTSQAAADFYNRLMDKYNNMPPEKPLFSDGGKRTVKDISSTKDRVKQALKQQEIEESSGHRRRKKSSKETSDDKVEKYEEKDKEKERDNEKSDKDSKPKIKKKPAPPPMDFASLLKLAEKKQYEPIIIEAKPKQEEVRLMTKKQQKEYQKEKEWRERKEKQKLNPESYKANGETKSEKPKLPSIPKISKPNSDKSIERTNGIKKNEEKPAIKKPLEKITKPSSVNSSSKEREREKEKEREKAKYEISEERRKLEAEKKKLEEMRRSIEEEKKKLALSKNKSKEDCKNKTLVKNSKEAIRNTIQKPALKDIKSRQFPPPDVRSFKKPEMKKKPNNKRRLDSDEEYDSELDDFIVNEDEDGQEDYSKYISEIFNYDKSKYRQYEDDYDDGAMESNFAQQLKEEFVSTKIGLMEDLEDIRREKMIEARRKKTMTNKRMKK